MASRTPRKGTSRYKIRNWKQYKAGLIQRGSISFWINDNAIDQWNPEELNWSFAFSADLLSG